MTTTLSVPRSRVSSGLLAVLSGGMLIDTLEVSMGIVALPWIAHDLELGHATAQWVVGGFALGFGGLLLAGRHAVARLGRRRTYLVALLVFAAASVASALTTSAVVLIGARVVKGGCAALTAPTGLAIIGQAFPRGAARNRAISLYSTFGACGLAAGLLLSGLLTDATWRWTFLLPAPAAFALFLFGTRLIPEDGDATAVAGVERRLPVTPRLARSALGAAALNGSLWGLLIVCTFRLQEGLGWTPLRAGLALLPAALPAAITAPYSARLVSRFGRSRLIALGAALPSLGYLLFWHSAGDRPGFPAGYGAGVLPGLLLVGVGYALCFSALQEHALGGLRPAERAMATALFQTAVQLGGVVVLVLVTIPELVDLEVVAVIGFIGFFITLTGMTVKRRRL